ncbi:protein-L-isoaspartate(D-aspartate) O-methyltransferase [Streptomyces sp. CC77]|nr:methyltransferase domain-containing protein [Streptomyces sp. CC77]OII67796.1 protein-L-isoaspartate(D-aspartate) O-methyltransferase [Streptomyces sp. CC77]
MTATAFQGRPSRIELGRRLIESGALSSDWAPSFAAVDRAAFLPDRIWPFVPAEQVQDQGGTATARAITVDRRQDEAAWYGYADTDLAIVTQWEDGGPQGSGPGQTPTSSSSQPSVVYRLLAALGVDQGMRVLDAGTGTGETAGLLAHRCGARGVATVEVDTAVASAARERLCRAGLYAEVVVGDALAGHPAKAPFDRLLCTFGVRAIPAPWLQQARRGGVIVAPYGTHYSSRDAAARLTVRPDGTASGPFFAGVEFMKARTHRTVWPQHGEYVKDWPGATGTAVQPDDLADTDAEFAIGLAVPGVTHTVYREADGTWAAWFYSLTDQSWACVHWPREDGPGVVHQDGPRRLWDGVDAALAWWDTEGRPGVTRFGLTVTPEAATPWVDEPGNLLPGTRWR